MNYTREQIIDYITGWLIATEDGLHDIRDIRSTLHNSDAMLEDDQDGIEGMVKRNTEEHILYLNKIMKESEYANRSKRR